jgi:hypothetical protein
MALSNSQSQERTLLDKCMAVGWKMLGMLEIMERSSGKIDALRKVQAQLTKVGTSGGKAGPTNTMGGTGQVE